MRNKAIRSVGPSTDLTILWIFVEQRLGSETPVSKDKVALYEQHSLISITIPSNGLQTSAGKIREFSDPKISEIKEAIVKLF